MANKRGKKQKQWQILFSWAPKSSVDDDCSHEIKSSMLLGRKAMTNLLLSHFSRVRLCATHRWQPTRLPCPWDSPGKNTGVGCHFLLQCMKVKSESEVAQSCLTVSYPMDCSPPGSSVHGIFQARVLEGVPLPSLMINLDSILKSRDITLLTKIYIVKAMVFPVAMYRC